MDIFKKFLSEILKGHEEAYDFLYYYIRYIHAIDDTVDEPKDVEKICYSHYIASILFSSDYFIRWRHVLGSCWHSTLNIYATSVQWEKDHKEWSDIMRHVGVEMLLKVVQIEFGVEEGWKKMRELDAKMREQVYLS